MKSELEVFSTDSNRKEGREGGKRGRKGKKKEIKEGSSHCAKWKIVNLIAQKKGNWYYWKGNLKGFHYHFCLSEWVTIKPRLGISENMYPVW